MPECCVHCVVYVPGHNDEIPPGLLTIQAYDCRQKDTSVVPLKLGELWLPWSSPKGELMCTPWEYARRECLEHGKGLLPWEWQHIQDVHLGNASITDGHMDDLVIHAVHSDSHAFDQQDFNLANFVIEVEAAKDLPKMLQVQTQPVLFIDDLVHVDTPKWSTEHQDGFKAMQQECLVLNPDLYLSKYKLDGSWRKADDVSDALEKLHKPARLKKGRLHRQRHTSAMLE